MADYLISTPAIPTYCRRCHTWMLTAHTAGCIIHTDPIPLTPHQELAALLDGRSTFDIHTERSRHAIYLEYRTPMRIKADRKHTVVTEHKCGHVIGVPPKEPILKEEVKVNDDKPPF